MGSAVEDSWAADRALARRCAARDAAAQRELYEREKRSVHATLYRIFGSNRHVEDTLQEVFLQVFRSLEGYRGEASLATWIHRTVVRVAFAELARGRRRGVQLELVADIPSPAASLDQTAHAREGARRLYLALDELEHRQRLAFVLHAIEGHSLAEVADLMDATLVATKARVFRARLKLEASARQDPVLASFLEEGESK